MIDFPSTAVMTCDGCGEEAVVDLTEYGGDPPVVGVDDSTITDLGWLEEDGEHFCPECREGHD